MQVSSKQNWALFSLGEAAVASSMASLRQVTGHTHTNTHKHCRALARTNCARRCCANPGRLSAGRGPAEPGHRTPDGPERPEEEDCPKPSWEWRENWSASVVWLQCMRDLVEGHA